MDDYQLAQVNIGRLLAPLDDPVMAGFVAMLHAINALAERSPGFVWRLQDETGYSSSIRAFDDPLMAINLTVWDSIDALREYTYYSGHVEMFRRRAEWFDRLSMPYLALWWIPSGHLPTIDEASARLEYLTVHGPTPYAFTFRMPFTSGDWLVYQTVS